MFNGIPPTVSLLAFPSEINLGKERTGFSSSVEKIAACNSTMMVERHIFSPVLIKITSN